MRKRNQRARQGKHYLRCHIVREDSVAGAFKRFDESLDATQEDWQDPKVLRRCNQARYQVFSQLALDAEFRSIVYCRSGNRYCKPSYNR